MDRFIRITESVEKITVKANGNAVVKSTAYDENAHPVITRRRQAHPYAIDFIVAALVRGDRDVVLIIDREDGTIHAAVDPREEEKEEPHVEVERA